MSEAPVFVLRLQPGEISSYYNNVYMVFCAALAVRPVVAIDSAGLVYLGYLILILSARSNLIRFSEINRLSLLIFKPKLNLAYTKINLTMIRKVF